MVLHHRSIRTKGGKLKREIFLRFIAAGGAVRWCFGVKYEYEIYYFMLLPGKTLLSGSDRT